MALLKLKGVVRCVLTACAAVVLTGTGFGDTFALTPAGVSDGFTLSNFATIAGPTTSFRDAGVGILPNGNVLANSDTHLYAFRDVDGQTLSSALFTTYAPEMNAGIVTAGGQVYGFGTVDQNGLLKTGFFQYDLTGSPAHVLSDVTVGAPAALAGDPVNGHFIASTTAGLVDVDPLANGGLGSFRVITNQLPYDGAFQGLAVSADGHTLYGVQYGEVYAYDIASGMQLSAAYLPQGGPPVGVAVITSTNALNGDLVVNYYAANGPFPRYVVLFDPSTGVSSVIANGGNFGGDASPDTSNGTLFLGYNNSIARLSCGSDCSFDGRLPTPAPVPEPGTLGLLGTGLGLFGALMR